MSRPTAPRGLQKTGRKFWRDVVARYQLRIDELRILEDACREMDLIERIEAALVDAPLMVTGSMGQQVSSPLVQELRQHRNTLRALLKELKLPDTGEGAKPQPGDTVTNARAAAMKRWGRRGA